LTISPRRWVLLYAAKLLLDFTKYKHMKQDVVVCAFVFVENFLGYAFAKN